MKFVVVALLTTILIAYIYKTHYADVSDVSKYMHMYFIYIYIYIYYIYNIYIFKKIIKKGKRKVTPTKTKQKKKTKTPFLSLTLDPTPPHSRFIKSWFLCLFLIKGTFVFYSVLFPFKSFTIILIIYRYSGILFSKFLFC